jgi:tRNA(fMet)-specific endonuclease VapC
MRRFILDTGIAGLYRDRKQGVFERAEAENALGNRIGIAAPVLAELAFRAEGSPQRDRNILRLRQALDAWKLWLADTASIRSLHRFRREPARGLGSIVWHPENAADHLRAR